MKRILPLVFVLSAFTAHTVLGGIAISPNSITAGSGQFILTVNRTTGTTFTSTSVVNWNGSPLSTTFVSSTQLTAIVPAMNVATAGTASVTVGSNSATFTINNPVPAISSISPTSTTAGSAQFTLTVNGTNIVATSTVKWNGSALVTTFVSSTQLTAIVPAANVAAVGTASVTVVNPTPGGGTSNALTFTINPPPPVITSSTTPTGQVCVPFSYTITATNNPTSYGASGLPAFLTISGNTISGTPTAPGTYTFTVGATNAGGTGTATVTLTVGNAPTPTITSPLTAAGTVGVGFTYTIVASPCVTSYNATGLPAGLSVNTTTGVISGTPAAGTDAGSPYSVTISATNSGGTGSATLILTIKPPAPVITSPTTATGQVGVAFSYQITATNNPTSFNATGLPAGLSVNTSTGLISGTPTTAGTYSVTISATNAGGTGSATLTLTIKPATPVITSSLTASGQVGVAFSYTITATNSPASYGATGLPTGLSVNTGTGVISGTPAAGTDAASPYSVVISATNSGGTGSATLVLTINPAKPVIQPPFTATGQVGVAFSYQITATNNPTSYNATGLPSGLTVNTATGLISGTPAAGTDAGSPYSVTISATNSGGTGSHTLTLTIKPAAPVITSTPTASGTVGVAFSYQITASNNPTSFGATALPPGLVLETKANKLGLIDGTPTTAGIYPVTISATNAGGTGTAMLVITIGPFTASGTQGAPFSYQIPASGTPASYNATGVPPGLTVDPTTGVISGTPSTPGAYSVTISATYGTGSNAVTGSGTLTLTINFPTGVTIPAFPGQTSDLDTGSTTPPSASATITFPPNETTGNFFQLVWNGPGPTNQNSHVADLANGGLKRNNDPAFNSSPVAMQYNPYDPTGAGLPSVPTTPNPNLNVWRGNPSPPNVNSSGQFGDPRASWYITDPWPAGKYWLDPSDPSSNDPSVPRSYWGGPTPQFLPVNWPDSGHNPPTPGAKATAPGQFPDALASAAPTPDPTRWISQLAGVYNPSTGTWTASSSGNLASVAELGNVFDPAQLSYAVTNPGGALPDIPSSANLSSTGGGGHTLAIGRPEFSMFDQNGMRAWQLMDVFSAATPNSPIPPLPGTSALVTNNGVPQAITNTAGLVNLNTASRDVLRALAAGILQNKDPAIQPSSLTTSFYPPTVSKQADLFADAVINSRPLLSTSALSAIRVTPPGGSQPEAFFGNPHQYSNQTQPTEWNDGGREELFAKILNLTTTRSRNFRVFVTGQSLDKNGSVLSTVTKVYHVFVKPNRNIPGQPGYDSSKPAYSILSQQIEIKYEGSM